MTFHESNLQFEFDARRWVVKKYDSHRYYKGLSSVGLKAVDFIGLLDWETVVLIEVKNYRDRPERERPRIIQKIAGKKPRVVKSFTKKVEDTMRAIDIIGQYLQRKRLYRMLQPYLAYRIWQGVAQRDWIFWTLANRAIERQKVVLVLWLELSEQYDGLPADYMEKVRTYLAGRASKHLTAIAPKVIVADTLSHPFSDTLSVTFRPVLPL